MKCLLKNRRLMFKTDMKPIKTNKTCGISGHWNMRRISGKKVKLKARKNMATVTY